MKAVVIGTSLLGAMTSRAQTIYTIAAPAGSTGAAALGGSQNGGVIVGHYGFQGGSYNAFRWTPSAGVVALPKLSPAHNPYANGISRDGLVIGGTSSDVGFRWTQASGTTAIGPFGAGSPTEVNGLSGSGLMFFGQTRQLSSEMRAFTWTVTGGPTILPQLPGAFNSQVTGCTPTGSVMVGTAEFAGVRRAMVWSGSGATNIGTLWPHGASYPDSISDDGATIWGIGDYAPGERHVVRWRQAGPGWVAEDMGIPAGFTQPVVGNCTPDGSVMVAGVYSLVSNNAFIWSSTNGRQYIGAWLNSVGFNTSGYTFLDAAGISSDGTAIWGTANVAGQRVGWVARDVPCLQRPSIILDPTDLIVACDGQTANMSVVAGGNYTGNLTYLWYKDAVPMSNGLSGNGSVYSGVSSANLTITNAKPGDAGYYWCEISNSCGSVISSFTEVQVYGQPFFTSLPEQQWICNNNGSVSFAVGAANASSYQWAWQAPSTGLWHPVTNGFAADPAEGLVMHFAGANTPTLTVFDVNWSALSSVKIRCGISGPCGAAFPEELTLNHRRFPFANSYVNSAYYCHDTAAVFTTSVGAEAQWYWQMLDPTFNTWLYLNDGVLIDGFTGLTATVSGAYTPTLSFDISALGTVGNALQFRALGVNECGSNGTLVATLTICRADFNCDGFVDFTDFDDFGGAFGEGDPSADFNGDGFIDFTDFDEFVGEFEMGC